MTGMYTLRFVDQEIINDGTRNYENDAAQDNYSIVQSRADASVAKVKASTFTQANGKESGRTSINMDLTSFKADMIDCIIIHYCRSQRVLKESFKKA